MEILSKNIEDTETKSCPETSTQNEEQTEDKKMEINPFSEAINSYVHLIKTQDQTMKIVPKVLSSHALECKKNLIQFMKSEDMIDENNTSEIKEKTFQNEATLRKFVRLMNLAARSSDSVHIALSNIVVAIVSLYDAFLSQLIRLYYDNNPVAFDESEKKFSINQILSYGTIENFKQSLIEKEVESVLRSSHTDQIKWLETKLNIPLTKDLKIYPDFVEITERRNLIVHANGMVSKQYLGECQKNAVKGIENVKLGTHLICDVGYVRKCYSVIFEMGIKLGAVVWHKIKPEQAELLYNCYSDICYNLIKEKQYDLSLSLLNFITIPVFKKDCPYAYMLVFSINKALCIYLKGEKQKAYSIVSKLDCSAAENIYRLAVAVIREKFDDAVDLMKEMGNEKNHQEAYKEWPLFTEFRKLEQFRSTYHDIFNEDYVCDDENISSDDFIKKLERVLSYHNAKEEVGEPANAEPDGNCISVTVLPDGKDINIE